MLLCACVVQRLLTLWSLAYMLVDFFAFLLPFTPTGAGAGAGGGRV